MDVFNDHVRKQKRLQPWFCHFHLKHTRKCVTHWIEKILSYTYIYIYIRDRHRVYKYLKWTFSSVKEKSTILWYTHKTFLFHSFSPQTCRSTWGIQACKTWRVAPKQMQRSRRASFGKHVQASAADISMASVWTAPSLRFAYGGKYKRQCHHSEFIIKRPALLHNHSNWAKTPSHNFYFKKEAQARFDHAPEFIWRAQSNLSYCPLEKIPGMARWAEQSSFGFHAVSKNSIQCTTKSVASCLCILEMGNNVWPSK